MGHSRRQRVEPAVPSCQSAPSAAAAIDVDVEVELLARVLLVVGAIHQVVSFRAATLMMGSATRCRIQHRTP